MVVRTPLRRPTPLVILSGIFIDISAFVRTNTAFLIVFDTFYCTEYVVAIGARHRSFYPYIA